MGGGRGSGGSSAALRSATRWKRTGGVRPGKYVAVTHDRTLHDACVILCLSSIFKTVFMSVKYAKAYARPAFEKEHCFV